MFKTRTMINLQILNKALTDKRLDGNDFKMLYYILNNISLNDGQAEIHNYRLMDVLNSSESTVQRVTKKLVECGYITKEIIGTKRSHQGNLYMINRTINVIINRTGDTPKKKEKESKENKNNILESIGPGSGTDKSEESYRRIEIQKKRIEKWNQDPQLIDYPTIMADGFLDEAEWFEKDIRNNLTEDEWYSVADYFNRVKNKYIEKYRLRAA